MPTSSAVFVPGDLVLSVSGDGDGSGTYGDNQASPIVLEQVTTSGAFVSQIVLPQTTTTIGGVTQNAISGEYGSSSEGTLEDAADGHSLVIMGYGVNAASFNSAPISTYGTTALAQTTSVQGGTYTAVTRVVADINAFGTVDTSTALYNVFNTNNPRSVATVNGSSFYISGQGVSGDTTQGVFVAADGASSATAIDHSTDTRTVEIYNNTLYVSRDSKQPKNGGTSNIASYGTGLPSGATTPSVLPGISQAITLSAAQENSVNASAVGSKVALSPENFFFANATTLYVADGGNPKQGTLGDGGLQKWTFANGTWTLQYTLSAGLNLVPDTASSGTTGLIGLTGTVTGNTVTLYATNATIGDTDQTYLYGITDALSATSGAGESFTTLVTAAADTNIRGIAFAPTAPCYARGTRILTARGEVAVEELVRGDLVVTFAGRGAPLQPIAWIGHRRLDIRNHPAPSRVRPVRIRAGALADGVPCRDLVVSPDHALYLDGALIHADTLVNGASIVQEAADAVEWFHIELPRHDVLLADGALAESYLDTGNRALFDNGGVVALFPDLAPAAVAGACAAYCREGALWRGVAERLILRAEALGWRRDEEPALHLIAGGRAVWPHAVAGRRHRFALPADCGDVRLVSRTGRPSAVLPGCEDRRSLGVGIIGLAADERPIALDASCLATGVHALEDDGARRWRWTDGDALIPAALLDGAATLTVEIGHLLAHWRHPDAQDGVSGAVGNHRRDAA